MNRRLLLATAILLLCASLARADLRPAALFCDHAVLQAGIKLPVWGWADAGRRVEVKLGDAQAATDADATGRWLVTLPARPASDTPIEMTIRCDGQALAIKDILIGEVWIGSGQSNMAMALSRTNDADSITAAADIPAIRLFSVKRDAATKPSDQVPGGEWVVCSPKTVGPFSAVLYHFGRNLHDKLKVPVGLISSSWGGTPIQAWMPRQAFAGGDAEIEAQRIRIRSRYPSTTAPTTSRPTRLAPQLEPAKLYNGMIEPLAPFAIRGVTWYQGENNVHQRDSSDYAEMMAAMVKSWRARWDQGDFAFLFVQLAPYGKYAAPPEALPEMWVQQARALALIPNSGMAGTGDVGNVQDIHPKNKQAVGERLARIALAKTYGRSDVAWQSPMFEYASRDGDRVRIRFAGAEGGLQSRDQAPIALFELAGADGEFVAAEASVDGNDVLVWSEKVKEPRSVRFAWRPTAEPNLASKAGLPAIAFRADVK